MSREARIRKMKIAILVPQFPPKWLAGTEIATYNIAKHLAKRGHEVHVITSLDEGLPKEDIEQGFYMHRTRWRKVRFVGVIFFWLKILLILKKIEPDIVQGQDISMGVPGFLAKKFLKRPYIVWGRGMDVYLPGLFMRPLSNLVLQDADTVIALTEDMKGRMQEICHRDILVIPNGIDLERFKNLSRGISREKLKVKEEGKLILFVGGLKHIKGLDYLLRAMRIIQERNLKTNLFLIGKGREREKLEELSVELDLNKHIQFLGEVANEKIPEYMAAADVFVLPSLSEGFPNVVLEAMAAGLPIVATRIGGLHEIVKDGQNGFLVEPRNPRQIADRVRLLLEDDELRERMSRDNKDRAKGYRWESIVSRLEELYQSLLQ